MEILEMKNVTLSYQTEKSETLAIKNIEFTVYDGEFVALIGPSGCGKTTLLSLAAGLIKPSSGSVTLCGKAVDTKSGDIGYMLQRDRLFEWRTILSNALLGLEVRKEKTAQNVAYVKKLIEKYGLAEFANSRPSALSGGMRQRAALIRTLAYKPKLLLLDEPFSALDYQTRLKVVDDVYSIIKSENKTALMVTHDISEAISLADRIIVLTSRPAEIKNVYTTRLSGSPLTRRDNAEFSKWFDLIYKDVSI